jgi:hypothetical protein
VNLSSPGADVMQADQIDIIAAAVLDHLQEIDPYCWQEGKKSQEAFSLD